MYRSVLNLTLSGSLNAWFWRFYLQFVLKNNALFFGVPLKTLGNNILIGGAYESSSDEEEITEITELSGEQATVFILVSEIYDPTKGSPEKGRSKEEKEESKKKEVIKKIEVAKRYNYLNKTGCMKRGSREEEGTIAGRSLQNKTIEVAKNN